MKDKHFRILVLLLVALGIVSTALLVGYTIVLYGNASIIEFIAKEGWWS